MPDAPEVIHITVPGSAEDPRSRSSDLAGTAVHRTPPLHPDDLDVIDGVPCTSLSRTLVDLAEVTDEIELRAYFESARERGRLDLDAVEASFARLEWRPSLAKLRRVIDAFSVR